MVLLKVIRYWNNLIEFPLEYHAAQCGTIPQTTSFQVLLTYVHIPCHFDEQVLKCTSMYCDSMSSPVHNIMGVLHDIFLRRIYSTRRPSSINGRVRVIGVLFWFINLLGNLGFSILRLFCRRATIGHDCPWSLAEDGTFAHDNVVVDCTLKLEFTRIQRVRGLDVITIIIIDASGMLDLETAIANSSLGGIGNMTAEFGIGGNNCK
mmetsp:Transcript_28397/g.68363  ORF Transcript_28397/g.68363 Transcript_28397/m.68363 type:complete len:206 (+) Transcript_28397:40-657(+)